MSVLSTPYGFLRMAVGAKAFVDDPISLGKARAIIEKGMQTREAAFLRKLEGAVWTNPRSPYLQLLRAAGCEPGDVDDLVMREGVGTHGTREGAALPSARPGMTVEHERLDILYVGTLPPHPGGSAISSSQLILGFARLGHEVRALAPITAEALSAGDGFAKSHPEIFITRFEVPYFETSPDRPAPADYRTLEHEQIGT